MILILRRDIPLMMKNIHFVKGDGYDLIVLPDHTDGTSIGHEYFCIYDDKS